MNSVFPTTVSMVVTTLLALTDPSIMPNHGFYRPIHVTCSRRPAQPDDFLRRRLGFPMSATGSSTS